MSAASQQGKPWTTRNEMDFIVGLDAEALRGYLAAAEKRSDWGGLDAAAVKSLAETRLSALGVSSGASGGRCSSVRGL